MQLTVRPYHRRDRKELLRMAAEAFEGVCLDENIEKQFGKIRVSWRQHKKAAVEYDLANNPSHVLVGEVDGNVAGFVCCRLYSDHSTGHVANLAVLRQFQGVGLGRALMQAAIKHFRDVGMRHARIETLEQNVRARNFYPSLGFQEVGRQIFYFTDL